MHSNGDFWTISPYSTLPYLTFFIQKNGALSYYQTVDLDKEIYPAVYLKASIKITGGDGTKENPYTLSL